MADETIKTTPSQDAQGRWDELISPTQVLTDDNQEVMPKTTTTMEPNHQSPSQRCTLCQQHTENNLHNEESSTMDQDTDEADSQQGSSSDDEEEQSMQVSFSYSSIPIPD